MNFDVDAPPKGDNRTLALALAIGAAACLLFAAFSHNWVARPAPVHIGFGPLGCHDCSLTGDGGSMTNGAFVSMLREQATDLWGSDDKAQASSAFAPMGWATFVLCVLSGLGLLASAALGFKKQRRDLPIAPTSIALLALMGSLVTACVFVATKPGGPGFVGVSYGFWAWGIGAVTGILAAQMLAKLLRPVDLDLDAALILPE